MLYNVDVLIIGAGQAGLAMGYSLRQGTRSFQIVDAHQRIGEVWRTRYDSLTLFTPRRYSSLPGMRFPGEQDGLPRKEEVADYLEQYARHFSLPVELGVTVIRVEKRGELFAITTNKGEIIAERVVVATGAFQNPFIPNIPGQLSKPIPQIHSSVYRAEADLAGGSVFVVGGGNTGVQLALELSESRHVYFAPGEARKQLPLTFWGKSIFWWFDKLGLLKASVDTRLGRWLRKQKDPVFGLGPELREKIKRGAISLTARAVGYNETGIVLADGTCIQPDHVLWCTGFYADYSWINIPNIVNEMGMPIHQRGISPVEGLYFLGLPWQYRRGSALIGGVGDDAAYLAEVLEGKRGDRHG
ncbi:MAG: flavin-containing monooxygenase [Clostridia bacterium]